MGEPLKVGNVEIASKLALAPMAGITDLAFRTLCRELGAGYTVTELVSAKALCYQDKKTPQLLMLGENEHPSAAQIFGSDPACMETAAGLALEFSGADIVDINMGCPVPKVANSGDGSGLMKTPELAYRVTEAVVRGAGGKPVTVKIRLGWDKGSINCVEFAKAMEQAGAAAVAVHGRTRVQMYAGKANWDHIRAVKEVLTVPVIANGDVYEGADAAHILRYTGADMAMIGRGTFGNPWIFQQAQAILDGHDAPAIPPLAARCDFALRQCEMAAAQKGEHIACLEVRKYYAWYLKGVPFAGYWRDKLCHVETMADVYAVTEGIKRELT